MRNGVAVDSNPRYLGEKEYFSQKNNISLFVVTIKNLNTI